MKHYLPARSQDPVPPPLLIHCCFAVQVYTCVNVSHTQTAPCTAVAVLPACVLTGHLLSLCCISEPPSGAICLQPGETSPGFCLSGNVYFALISEGCSCGRAVLLLSAVDTLVASGLWLPVAASPATRPPQAAANLPWLCLVSAPFS